MKKKLYILSFAIGLATLQSCTFEDDEKFSDSAAERINKTVADDKTLLESAPAGWTLHYYTGRQYTGGGYTMLMKFSGGKVTVASDYTDPTATATSSYDIAVDQGPVLTFNTYNSILHQRAEVSQNNVEGEQGDFEFNIMNINADKDTITLKGKKYDNYMLLVRNEDSMDWTGYLRKIQDIKDNMWYTYNIVSGTDTIGSMTLDPDTRRATFGSDNSQVSTPYYVTTEGVAFPFSVNIDGTDTDRLKVNAADSTMTAPEGNFRMMFHAPKGWYPFERYISNHVIYYNNWKGTLHLKCRKKSNTELEATFTYTDGLDYTFILKYSRAAGNMTWGVQNIEDPSGKYDHLKVLALDSNRGYLSFKPGVGLSTYWNGSSFILDDNGMWTGYSVDGIVFAACDASDNLLGVYPVQLGNLAGGYFMDE